VRRLYKSFGVKGLSECCKVLSPLEAAADGHRTQVIPPAVLV
jgi:hypothetical protein